MKETPRIITFSRRSDPAFYIPWLLRRIEDGFCDVPNPFSGKLYRVPLTPDTVALFTFWTKNPVLLGDAASTMKARGFRVACFITVTGYPVFLEPNVPSSEKIADSVERLTEILSADALWWRYDPVLFSRQCTSDCHSDNFEKLCRSLWRDKTRRVIFSLAHIDGPYLSLRRALEKSLSEHGDALDMPPYSSAGYEALYEKAVSLFASLTSIAHNYGISDAEVCCSPKLRPGETRISQGHCLSDTFIRKIVPDLPEIPASPTRSGLSMSEHGYAPCGCLKSTDIGINGTCTHGCVYCYANRRGIHHDAIDLLQRQ